MDVNKIVCINRAQTEQWCVFAHHWCGLPVFVTRDDNQSRSALYRDGTCFIILGSDLIKSRNPKFLYNRLWHEVAHLYYRDVWKPWDLRFEFRADLVASAATGKDVSLDRLIAVKNSTSSSECSGLIEKRINNLVTSKNTYTKAEAFQMLRTLKPVNVTSSVRGNQYI